MTINVGNMVKVKTTRHITEVDDKVSDARGDLYRTKQDKWYDERYLEKQG